MKVYVILHTYYGYDGDIDRLETDDTGNYLIFSSEIDAKKAKPKSTKHDLWEVKEVIVKGEK